MMSFCKRSVHSFWGLTNYPMNNVCMDSVNTTEKPASCKCQGVVCTTLPGRLGLITVTGDTHRTPNVLESATLKSSSPPSTPPSSPPPSSSFSFSSSSSSSMFKKDPGGIGFIDDIGGGVNGLMSCTESLGFESCDERRVDDDEIDQLCSRTSSSTLINKVKWRKFGEAREAKKFPPPLSSLNHNGQPSFFLRPVRKDGRLELTEVRIDRPEILRASRQDGRLRLHLVKNEELDSDEKEQEEEEQDKKEVEFGEGKEGEQEKEVKENIEEEEEERVGEWSFQVNGEGFSRCHELVTHPHDCHHHHRHQLSNHHHNLHVWRQHCVTTR